MEDDVRGKIKSLTIASAHYKQKRGESNYKEKSQERIGEWKQKQQQQKQLQYNDV